MPSATSARKFWQKKVGKGILTFYENMDFAGILCMEYLERFSMTDILKEIQKKIWEYLKIEVSVGVGNIYQELTDLGISFREACEALDHKFYTGPFSVQFFSEMVREVWGDMPYPSKRGERGSICTERDG